MIEFTIYSQSRPDEEPYLYGVAIQDPDYGYPRFENPSLARVLTEASDPLKEYAPRDDISVVIVGRFSGISHKAVHDLFDTIVECSGKQPKYVESGLELYDPF